MKLEVVFSLSLYAAAGAWDESSSRGLREVGFWKDTKQRVAAKAVTGVAYTIVVSQKPKSRYKKILKKTVQYGVPAFFIAGAVNNELAHRRMR